MLVVILEAVLCIQGEPNLELILILSLTLTIFSLLASVWIKLASTSVSFGCSSARALSSTTCWPRKLTNFPTEVIVMQHKLEAVKVSSAMETSSIPKVIHCQLHCAQIEPNNSWLFKNASIPDSSADTRRENSKRHGKLTKPWRSALFMANMHA